jgi:hypothetical protein
MLLIAAEIVDQKYVAPTARGAVLWLGAARGSNQLNELSVLYRYLNVADGEEESLSICCACWNKREQRPEPAQFSSTIFVGPVPSPTEFLMLTTWGDGPS